MVIVDYLAFGLLCLCVIGLSNPSRVIRWGKVKTRKEVLLTYGLPSLILFIIYAFSVQTTGQQVTSLQAPSEETQNQQTHTEPMGIILNQFETNYNRLAPHLNAPTISDMKIQTTKNGDKAISLIINKNMKITVNERSDGKITGFIFVGNQDGTDQNAADIFNSMKAVISAADPSLTTVQFNLICYKIGILGDNSFGNFAIENGIKYEITTLKNVVDLWIYKNA